MNKKNTRKGFTIVELVIVIAVIAILATVLIPTFGKIIEKAENSKTLQTLRNEYTEYTIEVGSNFEQTITIQIDTDYYTYTNGSSTFTKLDAAPASGTYYWNGTAYVAAP